jgi:acetyl esterase
MLLEPEVLAHLEASDTTGFADASPAELRAVLTREIDRVFTLYGLPGPDVEKVTDHSVPVEGGTILLRSYHPANPGGGALPAHVLVHGGGWVTGSVDELVADATARHRAVGGGCVVVLVEYRLAPEHPFPTAVHDVVASLRWVRDHADQLGIDPDVITAGGSSAGANLATAAVLAAPDLALRALVLDVPALDLRPGAAAPPADLGPEYDELMAATAAHFPPILAQYLPHPDDCLSPLASPVLAEDASLFPETYLLTAELDVLRPGAGLDAAGVPVRITCYPGALHGSAILTGSWATARRWHDDTLAILRNIHSRTEAAHG